MFLTKSEKLEDKIVLLLALKPYITAREIKETLDSSKRVYTEQAIFKILKKLISSSVIVKSNQRYQISSNWTSDLSEFLNIVQNNLTKSNLILEVLSNKKRRVTFYYSNLLTMKTFWSHSVLTIAKTLKAKEVYSWNPHTWFYLLQSEHQRQIMRNFYHLNIKMYKVIGSDTKLDLEASNFWNKEKVFYKFLPYFWLDKRDHYFSIIEDILIEVKLSKKAMENIEKVYKCSIKSRIENLDLFYKCLSSKNKVSISISRNKKSEKLKKEIIKVFS